MSRSPTPGPTPSGGTARLEQGAQPPLDQELEAQLAKLAARSLRRRLRPLPSVGKWAERDGRRLLNLASNDYLGLADHPALKAAAIAAIERFGTGAAASRLVTGHLDPHAEAERRFAALKHAPAALLLPTGYMANLAAITALAGPGDRILLDKLCHASLIDAARLSGAEVRVFPHLNLEKLERLLARPHPGGRTLIVTDSVFSMDGDAADLPRLCDLGERYGAILVVDEAHATGVLGDTGAGLAELQGVTGRVHVTISTASKALGGLGGIVTGSQAVIDTLVNRARPFIYTTAVPPAQAAALMAALDVVRDEPQRRQRLATLCADVRRRLAESGWTLPPTAVPTPILPLIVGDADRALALAAHLESQGILAVAIRPPTVPPGSARVRLSLRCDLEDADVERLLAALAAWR